MRSRAFRKEVLLGAIALLVTLTPTRSVLAQDVAELVVEGGSGDFVDISSDGVVFAQSFTMTKDVVVVGVSLPLRLPESTSCEGTITVRLVEGDSLTGTVLGASDVPFVGGAIGVEDVLFELDPIELFNGEVYVVDAVAIASGATTCAVGWELAESDYTGGVPSFCSIGKNRCATEIGDRAFAVYSSLDTGGEEPPEVSCEDVTLVADDACLACGTVFGGPGELGDDYTIEEGPGCDYSLGETMVTVEVIDSTDTVVASCEANVSVVDETFPALATDAVDVYPWEVPVTFTVDALDNCGLADLEISAACASPDRPWWWWWLFRRCAVSVEDNRVTIERSGGVGTVFSIEATAEDTSGNVVSESVSVEVVLPERHHGCCCH